MESHAGSWYTGWLGVTNEFSTAALTARLPDLEMFTLYTRNNN